MIPSYEELRTSRKARQKFYLSKEWRSLREQVLVEEPLCRFCKAKGRLKLAEVVDHIVDIVDSPHLCLETDNVQPLCSQHHNQKTARTNNSQKSSGSPQSLIDLNPWTDTEG